MPLLADDPHLDYPGNAGRCALTLLTILFCPTAAVFVAWLLLA